MASIRIPPAWRQLGLHNGKGRASLQIQSQYQASSSRRQFSAVTRRSRLSVWNEAPGYRSGFPASFSRFASTSAAAAPAQAQAAAAAAAPITTPAAPAPAASGLPSAPAPPQAAPTTPTPVPSEPVIPLESLDPALVDITPHVGYLKEMGLDYGWGPTAIVQWTLEHIQVLTGLPIWGSVIASVILTRILILPLVFRAADAQARLITLSPLMIPLREKLQAAAQSNDQAAMAAARAESSAIMKKGDVKFLHIIYPMLFQMPLGYGLFRMTNGMATLPVPELQTSGFGWLTDLSIHDPTYLLPAMTAGILYYTLKTGGEQGETATQNAKMQKYIRVGMPVLSLLFTSWLSAITQIGFFVGSIWGAAQATIIRNPTVRQVLHLHPLPTRSKTSKTAPATSTSAGPYSGTITRYDARPTPEIAKPAAPQGGIFANLKQSYNSVNKEAKESVKGLWNSAKQQSESKTKKHGRLSESEVKSATTYEEKRRKEAEADAAERAEIERQQRRQALSSSRRRPRA